MLAQLATVDWLAPKFIVLYVFVGSMMYVHLRGRHDWPAERAKARVVDVVLNGIVTEGGEQ